MLAKFEYSQAIYSLFMSIGLLLSKFLFRNVMAIMYSIMVLASQSNLQSFWKFLDLHFIWRFEITSCVPSVNCYRLKP